MVSPVLAITRREKQQRAKTAADNAIHNLSLNVRDLESQVARLQVDLAAACNPGLDASGRIAILVDARVSDRLMAIEPCLVAQSEASAAGLSLPPRFRERAKL